MGIILIPDLNADPAMADSAQARSSVDVFYLLLITVKQPISVDCHSTRQCGQIPKVVVITPYLHHSRCSCNNTAVDKGHVCYAEEGLMHLQMQHERQCQLATAHANAVSEVSRTLQETVAANR